MSLWVRDARLDGVPVDVRVEDGRVAAIGTELTGVPGDEVLEVGGMALLPGLVNGHTHAAMTLFRGFGDDLPLMEWLQTRIWPKEAKLSDEDVYWGTRLACAEMIRTGTVRFWDMYWRPGAIARAVEDSGIRATIAVPIIDGADPDRSEAARRETVDSLDAFADTGPRVAQALGPHAIYTVSEPTLRWIGELAAERDLPVHIHVSETRQEVDDCVAAHGLRPVQYLDSLGVLGERTLLAHGVWLDDAELDLVAERGATVVTNPVSNLKLAVGGVFAYTQARQRGISVGLGTDGAASNNSLDLFQDVKVLALIQKHADGDPATMPAAEAWAVATGRRAPALGQRGGLMVGEAADFLIARSHGTEVTPGDLLANLVYAAPGTIVDTMVVDGRVVMRGGVVDNEDEVREGAIESARRLGVA